MWFERKQALSCDELPAWPQFKGAGKREVETLTLAAAGLATLGQAEFAARCAGGARLEAEAALALACAGAQRALGMTPYPVQIYAALQLLRGHICEMATGEGKSLAAALAAAAYALRRRRVHVVTTNSYLAARDAAHFTPLFTALGLASACLPEGQASADKRRAYAAEVVYGVGHEFGFDFLREQLETRRSARLGQAWAEHARRVTRGAPRDAGVVRDVALVDEADSVLIDEARSALILRNVPRQAARDARPYRWAALVAATLQEGRDYTLPEHLQPRLQEHAITSLTPSVPALPWWPRAWPLMLETALRAEHFLLRDVDYMVGDDEVLIIDEGTGRRLPGRAWHDGLHQAVEAREGLTVTAEAHAVARIARQRYFQCYRQLCGLSGTVTELAPEFALLYGREVVGVPRLRPNRCTRHATQAFATRRDKYAAIAGLAGALRQGGRPVLIGSRSVRDSEALAALLAAQHTPCQVLNARHDAEEAAIVACAGEAGKITVATHMAGRGTDVRLSPEALACHGLFVIGAEHSEEARLDRQLAGRAGRQGEPGDARFFCATEDSLVRAMPGRWQRRVRALGANGATLPAGPIVAAQRRAATAQRALRRRLHEADDDLQHMLAAVDE